MSKNTEVGELKMVKIVDCPLCTGGKLKIEIANGYKIIFDGKPSKMPLKKKCKCQANKTMLTFIKSGW